GFKLERKLGVEFARQLLHAAIVGEAGHVQEAESAVARRQQSAAEQRRTDAVTLPRLFDAERRFRFARRARAKRTQFGGATHRSADEEAVDDGVEAGGQFDIVADELIRDAAGKTVTPALCIQTQQMVSIFGGLTDPQFADYTAFGKDFLHWVS